MYVSLLLLTINTFDGNNKSTVMEMPLNEIFCSYHVNKMERCLSHHWSLSLLHHSITSNPGGGYFGLQSYGDVPTFRVDFLTQKYFRQGANLGFN